MLYSVRSERLLMEEIDYSARLPVGRYVGVSLSKYGPELLVACLPIIRQLLSELMADPDVPLVVFRVQHFQFDHWPEPERSHRQAQMRREGEVQELLAAGFLVGSCG